METTEKKKHKSGFTLLKEKLAKAESENKELLAAVEKSQTAYLELTRTSKENIKKMQDNRDEWKKSAEAKQTTIDQQSRKISQLTADLHRSETLRINADAAHSKKEDEMLRAMGPIRRWWWNLHHLPTFKEDERWNETN